MAQSTLDLQREQLRQATRGGFAFPVAYGLTMAIVTALAFYSSAQIASLALMFQGIIALPVAFVIIRMTHTETPKNHPLNNLSAFLAGSQGLAIPAYILVYSIDPLYLPMVFACVGAMHFVPYTWLQSSKAWLGLAISMAFIPFGMVVMLGVDTSYPLIPLVISISMLITGVYVYMTSH